MKSLKLKPTRDIVKGDFVNCEKIGLCQVKSIWWTQVFTKDDVKPQPMITVQQAHGGKRYRLRSFKQMELQQ